MFSARDVCQAIRLGAALVAFSFVIQAQQPNHALDALKAEAAKLPLENGRPVDKSPAFDAALLKWVETRLPENRAQFDADYIGLAWRIGQELEEEELRGDEHQYVDEFTFTRLSRAPELLIVPVNGQHLYAFGSERRTKLLDVEPDAAITVSTPDALGHHLLLVEHRPTHRFDLYRLKGDSLQKLTSFAPDQTPTVDLQPSEITIEYIGGDERHKRTHVLRYRVNAMAVERIDPIAYSAAAFVDEWLTSPWSDMASRTTQERRGEIAEMRHTLTGPSWTDKEWPCREPAGLWQVSQRFESKERYFLLKESGPHRFMVDQIADTPFKSCVEATINASDSRLDRLVAESRQLQSVPLEEVNPKRIEAVYDALREWLESHLPPNRRALEAEFAGLGWQLETMLAKAPFAKTDDDHPAGDVGIKVERFSEYPDGLVVTANVSVPCGSDTAVYLYRFTDTGWTRVLSDYSNADWFSEANVRFSMPGEQEGSVFLVERYPVQCASVWSTLGTHVYRVSGTGATPILSKWHEWVIEESPVIYLTNEELSMELLQGNLGPGFRTQQPVRYRLGAKDAELIEPVAYSAEDFVHRWVSEPWDAMQSRSNETRRERLAEWHAYFAETNNYVSSDDPSLEDCPGLPEHSQVSARSGIDTGRPIYFLIHERGRHQFTMVDISWNPFKGCPAPASP